MATLQDRFTKLEAELKKIDGKTRLAFLLGGLLATTDELGLRSAQVEAIVKQAIAQRAAVLARMRQAPLVPDEVPTVKLGKGGDAPPEGDGGPPCAFCGLTERKGRHNVAHHPNTWHGFRPAETLEELESAALAAELRRPPA